MTRLPALRSWVLMGAAASILGALAVPSEPIEPTLVKPRRDGWLLPALPRPMVDNAAAAEANIAPYWGIAATAATAAVNAPTDDPRWRIAAIFGTTTRRGVLIVFEQANRPPQRLYAGDKLPSGHLITRITEREACVQLGKKSYKLGVERREL